MNCQQSSATDAEFDAAALVALGSNLSGRHGDPAAMVGQAFRELRRISVRPPRCSSLYRAEPVDCAPGTPDFVNAVAALWPLPALTPQSLLEELLQIEAAFGRQRDARRNAPRVLDLDLLCWGDRTVSSAELQLPHPRFCEREFVLAPLAELAPRWIPPGQSGAVSSLLNDLPNRGGVGKIGSGMARPRAGAQSRGDHGR